MSQTPATLAASQAPTAAKPVKRKAAPGYKLVWCILYDRKDGKSGSCDDGMETFRTTNEELAKGFAAQNTSYGQPIVHGEPDEVPMKLYTRWCREGKA